ncbi:tissue inhibitor of metalloproteinase-like [Mytilus californianus]|uniref:tissue inhibitor of metalloproteinase-like n=1 Tax=Mytilus californianus TaxID=6549 RepID=UPI002246881A|nr:tissue inhibitor of metalloproteinase-like [Mytilus californianus]
MSLKIFLLIIVLAFMTRDVHGCSCIGNPHPQDQFCSAAYVLYGKIIKEQFIPGPPGDTANNDAIWKYTFSILFKMKGVTERVGSEVVIETAGNGGLCGVRLPVGKSYIIMGRGNSGDRRIGLCDFIRELSSLSPYQTFYLFTGGPYSYNFNCKRRCTC